MGFDFRHFAKLRKVNSTKMKLTTLLLLILLSGFSVAQSRFVVSDTNNLIYSKCEWEEIDSVVFILSNGNPPFCDSYEVYFDDHFQHLAYKSERVGDSCITYNYWRSGQLKKRTVYLQNANDFPVWWSDEIYCKNGATIYKGPSPNQPGKNHIISYYCNGNKKIEYFHEGIGAEGKMTSWHENGNLESELYFENNEPINTWKYYNPNGELIKEEFYENGQLTSTKEY